MIDGRNEKREKTGFFYLFFGLRGVPSSEREKPIEKK